MMSPIGDYGEYRDRLYMLCESLDSMMIYMNPEYSLYDKMNELKSSVENEIREVDEFIIEQED